jgi:hypothetical protein
MNIWCSLLCAIRFLSFHFYQSKESLNKNDELIWIRLKILQSVLASNCISNFGEKKKIWWGSLILFMKMQWCCRCYEKWKELALNNIKVKTIEKYRVGCACLGLWSGHEKGEDYWRHGTFHFFDQLITGRNVDHILKRTKKFSFWPLWSKFEIWMESLFEWMKHSLWDQLLEKSSDDNSDQKNSQSGSFTFLVRIKSETENLKFIRQVDRSTWKTDKNCVPIWILQHRNQIAIT